MDETQTLAVQALRDLLDNPDRDDWDELLAANRALIKATAKNKPMTRNNARIVAEYLREARWRERAIRAATTNGGDYGRPHRGRGSRDYHAEAGTGGGQGAHSGDGRQGQRVQAVRVVEVAHSNVRRSA